MEAQPPDPRAERGRVLANEKRDAIKMIVGSKFLVPSATQEGGGSGYVVDTQEETCTCPDYQQRGGHGLPHRCKHLWAAIYVMELPDGSAVVVEEKQRINYPRNWQATNACRTLIPRLAPALLAELVDGLCLPPPEPGKRGRPAVPIRDVLLAAALRTLDEKTAGAAVVAAENYCGLGQIQMAHVPHYNTLLDRFADPELMPILHRMIAGSAYPLIGLETTFGVDGTGFGSSVYDHYFAEKRGPPTARRKPSKRHRWVEAKIVYGRLTHCVAAVQITEARVHDGPLMPELLRRVVENGGRIGDWVGDAAYLSWYNIQAVQDAGGTPYFDWKKGVTGSTRPIMRRLYNKFRADQEDYWKHYHQRSLSEAGHNMMKTRFGHYLRSRKPNSQYAESMLRCICHNVACLVMATQELGIDPKYWTPPTSPAPLGGPGSGGASPAPMLLAGGGTR